MRKIIHLSDTHIGYEDLGERFRCIVDNIIFVCSPAEEYVVLWTGDLVESALDESNYEEARAQKEKLEAAGFIVLVIPGNHDYGTGLFSSKKYVKLFKETFYGTGDVVYPKLDVIDDVAFIGLDTMAEEIHWYDRLWANGELGDEQLKRLDSLLGEKSVQECAYRVVYMHHHPFNQLMLHELKDSEALGEALRKHCDAARVDALLFGHNHYGKKWNGTWDIARCYDAGSTTRKWNFAGYHRIIDLSKDPRLDYDGDFHCSY